MDDCRKVKPEVSSAGMISTAENGDSYGLRAQDFASVVLSRSRRCVRGAGESD